VSLHFSALKGIVMIMSAVSSPVRYVKEASSATQSQGRLRPSLVKTLPRMTLLATLWIAAGSLGALGQKAAATPRVAMPSARQAPVIATTAV
jgi:hypothetical protein